MGRRQVQEAMANMGLTDSGLSRVQQTGLTVHKNQADADVRLAQERRTQELENQIAQILENAAAQKQEHEAAVRGSTADWFSNLNANYYSAAQQQGAALYEAERQREAAAMEAQRQREADAAALERQIQAALEQQKIAASAAQNSSGQASGNTGKYILSDTPNTTQFRGTVMTKGEFSRRTSAKDKYGSYDNYIQTFLAQWYNENKLTDAEFAFLVDYYGF